MLQYHGKNHQVAFHIHFLANYLYQSYFEGREKKEMLKTKEKQRPKIAGEKEISRPSKQKEIEEREVEQKWKAREREE